MMNREIKFKGYSESLEKWLYGSLATGLFENSKTKEDCPIIIDVDLYPNYDCLSDFDDCDASVDALSVAQYTGYKDKNGVDIYENDILRTYHSTGDYVDCSVHFGDTYELIKDGGYYGWYCKYLQSNLDDNTDFHCQLNGSVEFTSIVIGNTYKPSLA